MRKNSSRSIAGVPQAVSRLRLCSSLDDCGRYEVAECIRHSTVSEIFVYDDNDLGYSDWSQTPECGENKCLRAQNPNGRTLVLLPLDNRIVTGESVKKGHVADCALLTELEMSFIEFKTNATSQKQETLEEHLDKAALQLWRTYHEIVAARCRKKGVEISEKVGLDFYIVFDRNLDVTSAMASRQELMVDFLEEHKFSLYVSNDKTFG